jgi:hypothetical protein
MGKKFINLTPYFFCFAKAAGVNVTQPGLAVKGHFGLFIEGSEVDEALFP